MSMKNDRQSLTEINLRFTNQLITYCILIYLIYKINLRFKNQYCILIYVIYKINLSFKKSVNYVLYTNLCYIYGRMILSNVRQSFIFIYQLCLDQLLMMDWNLCNKDSNT
jgi:hypothetical protein